MSHSRFSPRFIVIPLFVGKWGSFDICVKTFFFSNQNLLLCHTRKGGGGEEGGGREGKGKE